MHPLQKVPEKHNSRRKWHPRGEIQTATSKQYHYIYGYYDHEVYGENCFRISKYRKEDNNFIGHFVVIPEDQPLLIEILKQITSGPLFQEREEDGKPNN